MISTLKELIAPLSEEEFFAIQRSRVPTLRKSSGANRFAELLSWDRLCKVIESDSYSEPNLRVTLDGNFVPPILYRKNGKVMPERTASLDRQGASFIAGRLELFVPELRSLSAGVGERLSEDIGVGAICSAGKGGALKRHYDSDDIVILQLSGSKHWRIYGQPVAHPVREMIKPEAPQVPPVFAEVLHEGDFLYLPGGYWHDCENGPGRSLHLGLVIKSFSGYQAIKAVLKQIADEEIFRVPLARFETAEERIAHEAALKARLIGIISQDSFFKRRTAEPQHGSEDIDNDEGTP